MKFCHWALACLAYGHMLAVAAATTIRVLVPAAAINRDPWSPTLGLRQTFLNQTGINVEFVSLGSTVTDYVSPSIQSMFSAQDSAVDIFRLDVVWIGDYGDHLLPLDGEPSLVAARSLHDPQNLAAAVYNGKLRSSLTRFNFTGPPKTLDEMERMMEVIVPEVRKTTPGFMGFSGQVSPLEGLTCNVLEWLGADNAGTILEPNRTLSSFDQSSITGQRVLNVAKRIRKWNQNGWLQLGLTESPSSRQWTQGGTLFHRNWPSIAAVTVSANVPWAWRISPMPGNAATLGGWLWGISKYTKQPAAAKRVLDLFASSTWQRVRALNGGNVPTIPELFNDTAVCAALPVCTFARDLKIVPRPSSASGTQYLAVSKEIFTRWNDIIRGFGGSIEKQLDGMNRAIADVLGLDILGSPTNISWDTAASAAFSAVAALEILTLLVLLGIFLYTRKHSVVSFRFMAFVIGGLVSQLVVVFLLVGVPSTPSCLARFWIHGVGYTLAVASIGARCFRIWTTSLNPFIERHDSSSRIAIFGLVPPLLVTVVILIAFSAAGSLNATDIKLETSRYLTCTASNASLRPVTTVIWYSWLGMQILAAIWFGIKASQLAVGSTSQEARTLTVSISNGAFLPVILIPFVDLDLVDQPTGFILRALAIVFPIAVFIGVFSIPQALQAIHSQKNPASGGGHGAETGLNTMHVTQADQKKTDAGAPTAVSASRTGAELQVHGTAKVGIAASTPTPALDLKALASQSFKETAHASEGILSEGMLVLQHLSMSGSFRGTCIPLKKIKGVRQVGSNAFCVDLGGQGFWNQFMVSNEAELQKWITGLQAAGVKEANAGSKKGDRDA